MQVAERAAAAEDRDDGQETRFVGARPTPPSPRHVDVVLKPLSRPDLGEIRIEDAVFAIGRTEQPFESYGNDVLSMLSRRHARIFRESGFVYLADLESRNGTTLNHVAVGHAPSQLRDGDEICFGGALLYRVQIAPRLLLPRPDGGLTVTLTPIVVDQDLDQVVVSKFPFLVGKADATFARYRGTAHERELDYLSRRQAYIYLKGGHAYIEDLASRNGTYIDGVRLLEHAVRLEDDTVVAFGGSIFAYRVGIAVDRGRSAPVIDPAARAAAGAAGAAGAAAAEVDSEKTLFVAAPTSFLDIFCDDRARRIDGVAGTSTGPAAAVPVAAGPKNAPARRRRGRTMLLLSEVAGLLAGSGEGRGLQGAWRVAAVAGLLGAAVATAYLWNAPERELKDALADGDFARAAMLAEHLLDKHPDDLELKARATEAALKANVPSWLEKIRARDFDGAQRVLSAMSPLCQRDRDLQPLRDELAWLGDLERLVSLRGGAEAPIRIYADEDGIDALIRRWNDDTDEHQRALARIASRVPQFGDWYGEALTHLRRLQSDSTVYLAVIERLKATIAAALASDNPEELLPVLKDAAAKYPELGGVDVVRDELARYVEIRREARDRKSGHVFARVRKALFVTPPFAQGYRALDASGQLPPADLLQQYDAAMRAWNSGDAAAAIAGLQKSATGPWSDAVADEIGRKREIAARFAALPSARGSAGYLDQLLAFRESLDPDEDGYFLNATAADLGPQRDRVLARAQEATSRARASWQAYRAGGPIDGSQRIETTISDRFRGRARLLAEASRYVAQGVLTYAQVDAGAAARLTALRDEIDTEARQQRGALHALANVLEPRLLKAKLELLGDPNP